MIFYNTTHAGLWHRLKMHWHLCRNRNTVIVLDRLQTYCDHDIILAESIYQIFISYLDNEVDCAYTPAPPITGDVREDFLIELINDYIYLRIDEPREVLRLQENITRIRELLECYRYIRDYGNADVTYPSHIVYKYNDQSYRISQSIADATDIYEAYILALLIKHRGRFWV